MPAETWGPEYETGIATIDEQHRSIFQSACDLREAAHTEREQEAASRALNHLVSYCNTHVEAEESHMDRLGFPGLAAHREQHRALLAQVRGLVERYAAGESSVALDLSILVTHWLQKHILEHDLAFARYARALDDTARSPQG